MQREEGNREPPGAQERPIGTIGLIGLGLIGGSLAKAIRRVHPQITLIGCSRNKETLVAALEDGTLNAAQDTVSGSLAACDLIFLCAPVKANVAFLEKLRGIVREDCILTDVGSVKTGIHEAVERLGLAGQFIGGHPMAGSERSGYANAGDRLLENAYYVLTPTGATPAWMLHTLRSLVESIRSLPLVLDYREHDRVVAAISHLPHIIAFTLVNLVRRSDSPEGIMRMLAAGGFKDITRIASSSPDMWQQICEENQEALTDVLQEFMRDLGGMETAIRTGDGAALRREFDAARTYRDELPQAARGSFPGHFTITVDVEDEPGAVSVIMSMLAVHRVSVKNIGIMNSREEQDGVLQIVLGDEESKRHAVEILRKRNYTVYEP